MIKMEIEVDKKILEKLGYDSDAVMEFLKKAIKKGRMIEECVDGGYIVGRGQGLDTDLAYMGLVADALRSHDWFRTSCKKMNLLSDEGVKDGPLYNIGDWIESYKKAGRW